MQSILFYFFAILMVGFGLGVVVNRNPVASALCLVVSFLGLAALFVTLDAFFIGIIQVLVYAGAVMVLFIFIIMLLDLKAEEKRKFNLPSLGAGILIALIVGGQIAMAVTTLSGGSQPKPDFDYKAAAAHRQVELGEHAKGDFILAKLQATIPSLPDTHLVGESIFLRYNLHLQVLGVLLLVATLGVVTLSKRNLR